MSKVSIEQGCPVFQVGGMSDHIHMLVALSRTLTISKLVAEIKANSSRWLKTLHSNYKDFSWQNGYGAFSVGQSNLQAAIRYIEHQKEHHKTMTFQEEFLIFLNKYQIEWEEKYLWD
jgi:putative transposase